MRMQYPYDTCQQFGFKSENEQKCIDSTLIYSL